MQRFTQLKELVCILSHSSTDITGYDDSDELNCPRGKIIWKSCWPRGVNLFDDLRGALSGPNRVLLKRHPPPRLRETRQDGLKKQTDRPSVRSSVRCRRHSKRLWSEEGGREGLVDGEKKRRSYPAAAASLAALPFSGASRISFEGVAKIEWREADFRQGNKTTLGLKSSQIRRSGNNGRLKLELHHCLNAEGVAKGERELYPLLPSNYVLRTSPPVRSVSAYRVEAGRERGKEERAAAEES